MKYIPQQDFAKVLASQGLAQASYDKVTDEIVHDAIARTIAMLIASVSNIPEGDNLPPVELAPIEQSIEAINAFYADAPPHAIALAFLGEAHDSAADTARAKAIIAAISSETLELTLPIFERGMAEKYPSPKCDAPIVREENLTQIRGCDFRWGLSAKQRSMVVAGYLVLLLAGGNQSPKEKVLLFYGDNHLDIIGYFEAFAAIPAAAHLLKRPRLSMAIRPNEEAI